MRNGPDAHTIGTFVVCAQAPSGYEIVRRNVAIN
jgi:hypothetical protein